MDTLLILFLFRSFLDTVKKNQKQFLFNLESPFLPFLYIILNGAQNFVFIGFIYETLIG